VVRRGKFRSAGGLKMPSEGRDEDYLNEEETCDGDNRTRGYSKIEQHFGWIREKRMRGVMGDMMVL